MKPRQVILLFFFLDTSVKPRGITWQQKIDLWAYQEMCWNISLVETGTKEISRLIFLVQMHAVNN